MRRGEGPREQRSARREPNDVDLLGTQDVEHSVEVAPLPVDGVVAEGKQATAACPGLLVQVNVITALGKLGEEPVVEQRDASDRSAVEVHDGQRITQET